LARHANTLNRHASQPGHDGLFGTPATMAMVGISARWHQIAHGPQGHNRHDGHRARLASRRQCADLSALLLGIPKQFCANSVLRQLEKNTTVDKHWLIKPMTRLRNT